VFPVDVVDVETNELADADTGGVEHLEDGAVAQGDGRADDVVGLRTRCFRFLGEPVEDRSRI
jgi:hypothetical protein